MTAPDTSLALIAYGPASEGQWKFEKVDLRPLKNDELLVRIVACGICLADVHFGDVKKEDAADNPAIFYPRVLGHEGLCPVRSCSVLWCSDIGAAGYTLFGRNQTNHLCSRA